MTTTNREDWLNAAVSELRPFFSAVGKPLPANVRVTCGFPSNAKRSGAIGECWADTASADKTFEVLISPVLDDPVKVFEVLVHELCHATAGAMNHGVNFQRVGNLMHLAPSPTKAGWKATGQAATFASTYGEIIKSLDAYPHAAPEHDYQKDSGDAHVESGLPLLRIHRASDQQMGRSWPPVLPTGL